MKKKRINIPIYNYDFTVFQFKSVDELEKMFPNTHFHIEIDSFDAGLFRVDGHSYIGFLIEDENKLPSPAIIAHECKHLVNDVFLYICHELDRNNDEPECYLLGWVVAKVCEFLDISY